MRFPTRFVLLVSVLFGVVLQSSTAQVQRRYVLGETVSFTSEKSVALPKSDFVGIPNAMGRRETRVLVGTAHQFAPPVPTPIPPSLRPRLDSSKAESGIVGPVTMGLVGGAIGAGVGGYVGSKTVRENCTYVCFLPLILGGVIGETIGLSSGVYLATEPRGNYALTLLGGTAVTVVGVALVGGANAALGTFPTIFSALAVPAAQFAVTIPIAHSD